MDYNTSRSKLKLAEYGRNIQMMIEHAIKLESKEERTKAADSIIQVMGNMNPQLKENRDFRHKLWDHLHVIADYNLDIEAPYAAPEKAVMEAKPETLPYPDGKIKYKHYGKIVEAMVAKGKTLEDGDSKNSFVKAIANHMKLAYMTWHKNSVPDIVIFKALGDISNGALSVQEGTTLIDFKEPPRQQTKPKKRDSKHYHKSSR